MRAQLRIFLPTLATAIALACMSSCNGGGPPTPTGPGAINATLKIHVGGGTSTKCKAPAISWTASSTAGSTQPKTSKPIEESDNVMSACEEIAPLEGGVKTIQCYCPVTMSFTGLAAGTWRVQAANTSCDGQVRPGQSVAMTLFTDGRGCTKFP